MQSTIVDEDFGIATMSVTLFRSIGQAFGVSIEGSVFRNHFDGFLGDAVARGKVPRGFLVSGVHAAGFIKGSPESVQIAYRNIYVDSVRTGWYVMMGIAGLWFLVSLWVRDQNLDKWNNGKQKFRVQERTEDEKVEV